MSNVDTRADEFASYDLRRKYSANVVKTQTTITHTYAYLLLLRQDAFERKSYLPEHEVFPLFLVQLVLVEDFLFVALQMFVYCLIFSQLYVLYDGTL